jgi:hypothetical protein
MTSRFDSRHQQQRIALAVVAGIAAALLWLGAPAPATATVILDETGQPFTGALNGGLSPSTNAVFNFSSNSSITCPHSPLFGEITDAGSTGGPAIGAISAIDWKGSSASEACPSTIENAAHTNFAQLDLPWAGSAEWLSDDTTGARNGTFTFSGVRFTASFSSSLVPPFSCTFVGDLNGTGATTRQVQADLFNPDNTASGRTEMRLVAEPLAVSGASFCPSSATLTATYLLAGTGGVKLQIREPTEAPGGTTPPDTAPDTAAPDTTITSGPKAKTKKKTATFEFGSSEPGSTFECSLDGRTSFKACASPFIVKVRKGKHIFQVQAIDQLGNADATPATFDWKVKKKKKK